MVSLDPELRSRLAKVVQSARREAEEGAAKALEALAVERPEAHRSMSAEETALRRRLRAHARQLGDPRDKERRTQAVGRLTHEVAYEHWHRMLFARFLAENQLLLEPSSGVAISMEECHELARERGEDPRGEDPWALAASFAQRMLPRIFRPGDPALEVPLPPEARLALERLLASLPPAVFTAGDALGWTYQFWQTEEKKRVNESGVKIGARELPAVTQLFTEPYMVLFLFHNTIGAWRAGKLLAETPRLAEEARDEEELRRAARLQPLSGYDFTYLRFVREPREGDEEGAPTGPWRPAAGAFQGWPTRAAELRVLDPCCGSGHFLVEGLELLTRLRMEEEGLAAEEAVRAALADNLFGLEIDPRCTQIAAFNVALTAWKLVGRPIDLPPLNIACSGLAPNATEEEWLALAERAAAEGGLPVKRDLFGAEQNLLSAGVRNALSALHALFQKAPELGSLIDPRALAGDLFQEDFTILEPLLEPVLRSEAASEDDAERAVAAQGMARAAEMLSAHYELVVTNVPFLARGKQGPIVRRWIEKRYPDARHDLATSMLARWESSLATGGTLALVTPQNWLFLPSYGNLRKRLLLERSWSLVARLGSNAFRGMNFWAATTALSAISRLTPSDHAAMAVIDVSQDKSQHAKALMLAGSRSCDFAIVLQTLQLRNPDHRITLEPLSGKDLLARYATSPQGIKTGDDPRFRRFLWETPAGSNRWKPFQGASPVSKWISGLETALDWQEEGKGFSRLQGRSGWGREGVVLKLMGEVQVSFHSGHLFDSNVTVVLPRDPEHLPALVAFCSSQHYSELLQSAEQGVKINNATAVKVPFDLEKWRTKASTAFPTGLPEPQSPDPTQWLFHGHPAAAELATTLQVAVARLLAYRWPPEQEPEIRLSAEAREWVERCRELDAAADEDGIVCLPALRGEAVAADRLRQLLSTAFGDEWSSDKERELLGAASGNGNSTPSLEDWLRDSFFEEHCRLFHHRPFVWHIWDGQPDGFSALVNYHRLTGPDGEGRRTLEALTYSYLGDWITRQRAAQREGKEGADALLAAALDLQSQLENILKGEPPYDLFIRWKPLDQQPIGWDPDINDGVRLNIRPFFSAQLRKGGRKGAGILRWKPNIHWRKDRGKEPPEPRPKDRFPWFWGCPGDGTLDQRTDFLGGPTFDGNRWNNLHYSTAMRCARGAAKVRENRGLTNEVSSTSQAS